MKSLDTNKKGVLTELQVMESAIKSGYIVSIPYGDCARYDQIWDLQGKMLRVQIKTARWKDNRKTAIVFNCYSVSNGEKHKYSAKDVDCFATFWEGSCYLVPSKDCATEKTLWVEPPSVNCDRICLAKDYELKNAKLQMQI